MTRLEASAWPLAGGSACVFVLAVLLGRLPWQVGFAAVILAVCCWAAQGPLVAGAAIGAVAWLCVTGFDVHRFGDIEVTGRADLMRAVVLVLAGVLAATAHAAWRRMEPVRADLPETGGFVSAQRPSAHSTEEPRDGRSGLHPADSGDLRPARPAREGGRTTVNAREESA